MKVSKVYKYGTGDIVPKESVYMNTVAEEIPMSSKSGKVRLVWHYFLVEVEE